MKAKVLIVPINFRLGNYSATNGLDISVVGSTLLLKQVACAYSNYIPIKAVLKFGNGLNYNFSLGSVTLPVGLTNGQKVLLDLELVEVKGEGVQVRVVSVRALAQGDIVATSTGLLGLI